MSGIDTRGRLPAQSREGSKFPVRLHEPNLLIFRNIDGYADPAMSL